MNEAGLQILITSDNYQALAGINGVKQALGTTGTAVAATTGTTTMQMKGLGDTLADNRTALRQLASGMTMVGTTALTMGIALKSSKNEMVSGIGNTVMMAGALMTAVGSSVQFISAISKMVAALKSLAISEAIVKAFQGPTGWVALGVGAAVAGGAVAGINAMSKSETKANITINNQIKLDGKQITQAVRTQTVVIQQQNNTSGYR
jgi:hypothetical protein